MVLPGRVDVESYIRELESTIEKLTGEIETLMSENESLKKKLLLYENPHTPPSLQPFKPGPVDPPGKRGAPMGHKGATKVLGEPDEIIHVSMEKCPKCSNVKHDLKLSDRIYHCDICGLTMDRDLNATINIRNMGLIKIGRGTPEFTPVEIGALPMATPVVETVSPLL